MRGRRAFIILVLAVMSGSLAGYSALRFLRERPTRLIAAEPTRGRTVVVAARDMTLGSIVKEEDVRLLDWPSDVVPEGYPSSVSEVIGRGLIRDVSLNEPLLSAKLADLASGGGLPIVIPEGMRALSVKVDEVIGVAGFVTPGTRVDVILTIKAENDREPVSRVILQNIAAVAAGQQIQRDEEGKPISVTVITVLVTPEEAEKLVLASAQGRIQMALRNTLDLQDVETRGVRVSGLLSGTQSPARGTRVRQGQTTAVPDGSIIEMYRGGVRTLVKY